MPSKKQQSRKNQSAKPMAEVTKVENDGWNVESIVMKSNPNTRSNKVKPEEPPRIIPDWEKVGMGQKEFEDLMDKMVKVARESQLEKYHENVMADMNSVGYWESRIETLERYRERYNTKAGWSADAIQDVKDIDAEIAQCEEEIYQIEAKQWDETVDAY